MRVLMTTDVVGGVWTYALELADVLARSGDEVLLATMGGPLDPRRRTDLECRPYLQVTTGEYRLEWMDDPWDDVAHAGEWLLGLERRWRPDVVHLNQFAHGALPWSVPAVVVGHSCVVSWWRAVRGGEAPPQWLRYREAVAAGLRGAAVIVAPTASMLAQLRRAYGLFGEARVVPNGVDPARFEGCGDGVRKDAAVLCAGRLWDEAKNVGVLADVAPELDWEVRVAGHDTSPDGRRLVVRNVRMLGALSRDELSSELRCAGVYAAPARYEPFGLGVLEAALAGCALVLGDVDSLRENWDGAACFVACDDRAGLRDVLRRVIRDDAARARLARAARARGLRFTAARMARGYRDVYARALARHDADRAERDPGAARGAARNRARDARPDRAATREAQSGAATRRSA